MEKIFRVVHNQDMFVHLPFEWMKYVHVPTEVFFSEDMQTYKVCNESGEDPTCSNKYFPNYTRADHDFYFFDISGKANCKLAWKLSDMQNIYLRIFIYDIIPVDSKGKQILQKL